MARIWLTLSLSSIVLTVTMLGACEIGSSDFSCAKKNYCRDGESCVDLGGKTGLRCRRFCETVGDCMGDEVCIEHKGRLNKQKKVCITCPNHQNEKENGCNNKDDDCDGEIDEGLNCQKPFEPKSEPKSEAPTQNEKPLERPKQPDAGHPDIPTTPETPKESKPEEKPEPTCSPSCTGGQACVKGQCICPQSAASFCAGTCVDTSQNTTHCGTCNNACLARQTCKNSTCECPAGEKVCGQTCVNTQNDTKHCGACGNACKTGEVCNQGSCTLQCGSQKNCGGSCVDTQQDNKHCGACGNACDTAKGEVCSGGKCECSRSGKETCNGIDDDCDGKVDNNLTAPSCSKQSGVCAGSKKACEGKNGWKICTASDYTTHSSDYEPTETKCDTKDNDCDGKIDEALQLCTQKCKKNTDCPAAYKNCQSNVCVRFCKIDKDCDDEYRCLQTHCQLCPDSGKQSGIEICDNKDNNCNGQVDEGVNRHCYSGPKGTANVGRCKKGEQTCQSGVWGTCVGEITPSQSESCNGQDDNCDGAIDETFKGKTYKCYGGKQGTAGIGSCKEGTKSCTNGKWTVCSGEVKPEAQDICNGLDENCNGSIDEGSLPGCTTLSGISVLQNIYNLSSIAFTTSGITYICGAVSGTVALGNKVLQGASEQAFCAKVDTTGKVQWATTYGVGWQQIHMTAIHANNQRLLVTGFFKGTGTIKGTTIRSNGSNDIFVMELDSSKGTVNWIRQAGGIGVDNPWGITADAQGNVYVAGEFSANISFGTAIGLSNPSGYDVFLAKLDSSGNWKWATRVSSTGYDRGRSVTTDSSGNVYLVGKIGNSQTSHFYRAGIVASIKVHGKGSEDAFVAKWDKNGVIKWATAFGSANKDEAYSLALSGSALYITGQQDQKVMWSKVDIASGAITWQKTGLAGTGLTLSISGTGTFWLGGKTGTTTSQRPLLLEIECPTGVQKKTKSIPSSGLEVVNIDLYSNMLYIFTRVYIDYKRQTNVISVLQRHTP